jgi:hypothetical protein
MAVEKPRSNLRFALMPTLTAGIGLLVLLAVGAVMVVHWIVDRDVVQDFATALVMRVLSAEEAAVRRHLDAAVHQGDFIAAAVSGGRYKLADPAFENFVGGSFAAAPRGRALRWIASAFATTASWADSQTSFAAARSRIGDRRSTAKRAAKRS